MRCTHFPLVIQLRILSSTPQFIKKYLLYEISPLAIRLISSKMCNVRIFCHVL